MEEKVGVASANGHVSRDAFVFSLVSGVGLEFGSDLGPAEAQPRAEMSPTEGSRSDVREEHRPSLTHRDVTSVHTRASPLLLISPLRG